MRNSLVIGILVAVLLGLLGSVYVVREDQTAIVLNLCKAVVRQLLARKVVWWLWTRLTSPLPQTVTWTAWCSTRMCCCYAP